MRQLSRSPLGRKHHKRTFMQSTLTKEEIIREVEDRKKSVKKSGTVFMVFFLLLLVLRSEIDQTIFPILCILSLLIFLSFCIAVDRCPVCSKPLAKYPWYCKRCGAQLKKLPEELDDNEVDDRPIDK